jgi:hypothetical protein
MTIKTTPHDFVWATCPLYPRYEVSNYGHVRRVGVSSRMRPYRMLAPFHNKDGYEAVSIYPEPGVRKTVFVHTLVLTTFVSVRPNDFFSADHLNGCRTDNRLCNLEWVPIWENTRRRAERRRLNAVRDTDAYGRKRS